MLTFRYKTKGGKPATTSHMEYVSIIVSNHGLDVDAEISGCLEDRSSFQVKIKPPRGRVLDGYMETEWEVKAGKEFLGLMREYKYPEPEQQFNIKGALVWRPVSKTARQTPV